jgi:hypothetical protein
MALDDKYISIGIKGLRCVSEWLCAGLGIVSRKLAVAIGGGDGNISDLAAGKAAGVGTREPRGVRDHETLTLL